MGSNLEAWNMRRDLFDEIHGYWFGPLPSPLDLPEQKIGLWFGNSPATDAEIGERFGAAIDEAAREEWDLAALTQRQRVGLIVLLDQFPRNLHRGTARVYAHDERAQDVAERFLDLPMDGLAPIEIMFGVLPLGHSELLAHQDRAVDVLEQTILPMAPPHGFWDGAKRQAYLYRDIIDRFGRFPHRNTILGRETTAEEATFMAETKLMPG
jgi:uncharacterized protein (DUF924 family)